MKNLVEVKNQTNEKGEAKASLFIYDAIGTWYGISAEEVSDAIKGMGNIQALDVFINSPGGDVFEARAIVSNLKRLSALGVKTHAIVDGMCASAATTIALGCDEVSMNEGTLFMIHEVATMTYGNKRDMRECADLMEKIEQDVVADYANKTGIDDETIIAMMEAETWMSAQEAHEKGFVDSVIKAEPKKKKEGVDNTKQKSFVGVRNANRLKLLLAQ